MANPDWLQKFEQIAERAEGARAEGFVPGEPVMDALPDRWGPADVSLAVHEGRTRDHEHWRPVRELVRARRHDRWAVCPVCKGAGHVWVQGDEFVNNRGEIHRYQSATPCGCQALDRRIELYNRAGMPGQELRKTWKALRWDTPSYSGAYWDRAPDEQGFTLQQLMIRWLDQWAPEAHGWIFQGMTGTGKTHLAHALMKFLILTHGASAAWWSSRELVREFDGMFGQGVGVNRILRQVVTCDVLVLDEFRGLDKWWWPDFVDALESRQEGDGKTTIITTNLHTTSVGFYRQKVKGDPFQVAAGDRLESRMLRNTRVVQFANGDERLSGRF